MAVWLEGKRDEKQRWKLYYVTCSNCGCQSSKLLESCPRCGEMIESYPPYLAQQDSGGIIDRAMKDASGNNLDTVEWLLPRIMYNDPVELSPPTQGA